MICNSKQPYEYVAIQVDKLYEKKFEDNETEAINKHCEFIASYINACGWSEEEFIHAMLNYNPINKFNN